MDRCVMEQKALWICLLSTVSLYQTDNEQVKVSDTAEITATPSFPAD